MHLHSCILFLSDTIQCFPLPLLIEIIRFFFILHCSSSLKLSFKSLNRLWSLLRKIWSTSEIWVCWPKISAYAQNTSFISAIILRQTWDIFFPHRICILLQFVFPSYTLFSLTSGMPVLLLIMECSIIPLSKIC